MFLHTEKTASESITMRAEMPSIDQRNRGFIAAVILLGWIKLKFSDRSGVTR